MRSYVQASGLAFLVSLLVIGPVSLAQSEPPKPEVVQKEKIIRELLELTDTGDLGMKFSEVARQQLAHLYPTAPQSIWDEWIKSIDPTGVNQQVVSAWNEHFSLEELTGLLTFYKTPAGQAHLEKMPVVMQQAMTAAQAWGQGEVAKVQERLHKEGHQPVQPQPSP